MQPPLAVVIGAGSTGCAVAHDLTLRGLHVTVVERGGISSGTTGHNGGQLHSGARYAVSDPTSARECAQENSILQRILPGALECNGGFFVALEDAHLEYRTRFLAGCADCGIPALEIPPAAALRMEPRLNPRVLAVVRIPDGSFDPYRFCLSFLASAIVGGAKVLPFTEVTGIDPQRGLLHLRSRRTGRVQDLSADVIVNAAGPWADRVAALGGALVRLEASAGVMVIMAHRLCDRLINLMAPPGDAQVIVPQRHTCLLGTTSWHVPGPDGIRVPYEQVEQTIHTAAQMLPDVQVEKVLGVMASARPLMLTAAAVADPRQGGGRSTPRQFAIHDHTVPGGVPFYSIIGGKTTTARRMAEDLSDQICARVGITTACQTAHTPLQSYRLAVCA